MKHKVRTDAHGISHAYEIRYHDGEKVITIPCNARGEAIRQRRDLVAQGHEVVLADVGAGKLIDE